MRKHGKRNAIFAGVAALIMSFFAQDLASSNLLSVQAYGDTMQTQIFSQKETKKNPF